jgi:hypothetical protein
VLRNTHARARNHKCSGSRNVEGTARITTGPGRINQRLICAHISGRENRRRVAPHRLCESDHFVDGFTLDTQRREQTRDQRLARAAGENIFHRRLGFGAGQVLIGDNFFERFEDHGVWAGILSFRPHLRQASVAAGGRVRRRSLGTYAASAPCISHKT